MKTGFLQKLTPIHKLLNLDAFFIELVSTKPTQSYNKTLQNIFMFMQHIFSAI